MRRPRGDPGPDLGRDDTNGASTLRITGGHLIDHLRFIAGEPTTLRSTVEVRIPEVTVTGSGESLTVTAPDVRSRRTSPAAPSSRSTCRRDCPAAAAPGC